MGDKKILNRPLRIVSHRKWLKIFGVTILAFVLSRLLFQPFAFSLTSLVTIPEKSDFNITDFYAILADSRPIKSLDKNIVIVDITQCDRNGIAEILDSLSLYNPLAVGLDVIFDVPKGESEDAYLLASLKKCPNLIIATSLTQESPSSFSISETSFFQDSLHLRYGAINFLLNYPRATIRKFPVRFLTDRDTVPSFATALTQIVAPEATRRLFEREQSLETINYTSRVFEVIQPDELAGRAKDIQNRIVLIGATKDFYDIHATPTNSKMSGVMIHAYSIATILEATYIKELKPFQNWLLAFLSCLTVIFISMQLAPGMKGIVMRIMQLGTLYFVLVIGYHLFITYNILINFSYTLFILSFGLFALDIWNGFETGISKLSKKLKPPKRVFSDTGAPSSCTPPTKK